MLYHALASPHSYDYTSTATRANYQHRRLLIICAIVVGVLMPVLASPIPYWLSSTIAAIIVLLVCIPRNRELVTVDLVPWDSLLLVTVISAIAAVVHSTGV